MAKRRHYIRVSIPVQDRERAKAFYRDKLGMQPIIEHEFATVLVSHQTQISLVESDDAGNAGYSLVTWLVGDIDRRMAKLRKAGVEFMSFDFGAIRTVDGKAEIDGDYVAWFKDSEGNLLAIAQIIDPADA